MHLSPGAKNKAPYVYAVPVTDRWLLYAPVAQFVAVVNTAAVRDTSRLLTTGIASLDLPPELNALAELAGEEGRQDPVKRRGPLAPLFLGIIPSRRCNMSCSYCSFGRGTPQKQVMSVATAVKAVEFMASYCESLGRKEYEIQFFGGEPLVEDRIIDTVVHHARLLASRTGILPTFAVSTNGLMTPDRKRFVGDYFTKVVLSLDGFREFHDQYRPISHTRGSFDEVVETARFLSTSQAQLCIRCCVTSQSVHHMESIARWFCEEFHPAVVNFEPMTESSESRVAGLAPPRPHDFARHALRSWNILRAHGAEPASASVLAEGLQSSSCPVGKDAIIVHPDGTIASCYLMAADWQARGMDLTIGKICDDGSVDIRMRDVLRLRRAVQKKPRCENCFCRLTCAGSCHVNISYPGCQDSYEDSCVATRALTACTLLEELGHADFADDIIANPDAIDSLSGPASDLVTDYVELG